MLAMKATAVKNAEILPIGRNAADRAKQDTMRKQRHEQYSQCPIEAAMDIVGGKWKGSLLFLLVDDKKRFSDLQRRLTKITQRTLTQQLRDLERDGMVSRKVYPVVPPRVEYSLTDRGRTLVPLLVELKKWGESYALPQREEEITPPSSSSSKRVAPAR